MDFQSGSVAVVVPGLVVTAVVSTATVVVAAIVVVAGSVVADVEVLVIPAVVAGVASGSSSALHAPRRTATRSSGRTFMGRVLVVVRRRGRVRRGGRLPR